MDARLEKQWKTTKERLANAAAEVLDVDGYSDYQ